MQQLLPDAIIETELFNPDTSKARFVDTPCGIMQWSDVCNSTNVVFGLCSAF
jgi:hypothetical protein